MKSRRRIAFPEAWDYAEQEAITAGICDRRNRDSGLSLHGSNPEDRMSALGWRVQPVDATPSNLARGGGVRWRRLHGYGSRRSRGLSFGSAGRTANVWRISLGRLRGGTKAVSIVSWLSTVALLRRRAGELRER